MRPKVKTARRKASKLHGASAGFVSLVDRGANETPFTLIKSAEGKGAMTIKKRSKTAKSHKRVNSGNRKQAETETKKMTVMAKMTFDADIFEDEEEVRDWIEKAEWDAENIDIQYDDNEGLFVARPEGTDDDSFARLAKVDTEEDGVEGFVGEQEVAVSDEDEEEEEKKSSDKSKSKKTEQGVADEPVEEEEEEAEEEEEEEEPESEQKKTAAKGKSSKSSAKGKTTAKKSGGDEGKTKLSKRQQFLNERKSKRETERKFDVWDARFSRNNTLAETLKAGMDWDGLPPGYYEVQAAAASTFANIVADDGIDSKQEALNKAALDFAEIIGGLDNFFDAYIEAEPDTVQEQFPEEEQRTALKKWADDYGDFVAGNEPEKQAKAAADASTAIDYNKISEMVADQVSKTVQPLSKEVKTVSGMVDSIASRRPTKKAAEPEDGGNGEDRASEAKEVEDIDKWRRTKAQKGVFG